MASTGAGPSRRSHTKSRKGCKTCKRRHIRCDENFPQWYVGSLNILRDLSDNGNSRNCTKHQVRCDYMETLGSDTESQHSPEQSELVLTPRSEQRVDIWQQTGTFPYPNLQVFPPPQAQEYSSIELRLIDHLSTISNDLLARGTSRLSIWTQKLPKYVRSQLRVNKKHLPRIRKLSTLTASLKVPRYRSLVSLRHARPACVLCEPPGMDPIIARHAKFVSSSWKYCFARTSRGHRELLARKRRCCASSITTSIVAGN